MERKGEKKRRRGRSGEKGEEKREEWSGEERGVE